MAGEGKWRGVVVKGGGESLGIGHWRWKFENSVLFELFTDVFARGSEWGLRGSFALAAGLQQAIITSRRPSKGVFFRSFLNPDIYIRERARSSTKSLWACLYSWRFHTSVGHYRCVFMDDERQTRGSAGLSALVAVLLVLL